MRLQEHERHSHRIMGLQSHFFDKEKRKELGLILFKFKESYLLFLFIVIYNVRYFTCFKISDNIPISSCTYMKFMAVTLLKKK